MAKLNQHQSVIKFSKEVLGDRFEAGRDIKEYAGKDDKRRVATLIAEGMLTGEVELGAEAMAKYGTSIETLTSKYVVGMVTNWWNKSKELNGGERYEAKNPGSRAGAGDPTIKEMKLLRRHLEEAGNVEGVAQVDAAIAQHLAASKPKAEINLSLIPDELKELVGVG